MLIVFGILGLIQVLFLPALMIRKTAKLHGGIVESLLQLFPLSLISNYLLVYLLSALHIYSRPVMLGVILVEVLGCLWLYRDLIRQPVSAIAEKISAALKKELQPLSDFLKERPQSRLSLASGWIWAVSGCLALSGVLWALHLCRLNFGTVFSGWDTLFSWNSYAEIWAKGRIPEIGGLYPQLLPANWSISYLLQGAAPVQFFNTLLPPLFFLMIQLMLFDLGFQRRESGFFFAAVIARYMMKKLMGDQLFDGYMDVPAAAMVLLSVYTILKAEGRSMEEQRRAIGLAWIFAAGAAITKQSGFIAVLLTAAAVPLILRDVAGSLGKKKTAVLAAAVLLIVLPWYLHCLTFSTHGEEREVIAQGIMDYNRTFDVSFRLKLAMDTLGKYGLCFLFSLLCLPFVPGRYRAVFFLAVWPLTAVWAVNYSYDARNLGVVLPFVSLACGLGLSGMGAAAARLLGRIGAGRIPLWVACGLLLLAFLGLLIRLYPDSRLKEDQKIKQKALFGERLNEELLYNILGETHTGNDVYTDYPAYFLSGYRDCCSAADLTDEEQVRSVLEGTKINWLLLPQIMPNNTDPSKALIEQCIADGRCKKIQCSDGYYKTYCLYELEH